MKTVTLSEIVTVKSACPVGKLNANPDKEGVEIKVVAIKDINVSDSNLNCEKIESVWLNDADTVDKYKLIPGQVLITAKGQSIRAQVYTSSRVPALPHTNLFVISDLRDNVLPEYLALYLSLGPVVDSLRESMVGTTILSLSKKDLEKVEVRLPDLSIQKKLVEFSKSGKNFITARKHEIENVSLIMDQTLVNKIMAEV
ncbi:MAG: restriction endonuclease subunit S [Bdellovibrionaceae bacterium]|nr:restriction endonuclease subunit S [Pseudobdellovibrionaceae bacterium]